MNGTPYKYFQDSYVREKRTILRILFERKITTLQELSRELNLSIPTITKIVNELKACGIIEAKGRQMTPEGKTPELFGTNASLGGFIGIEVKKRNLSIGYMDFNGTMLQYIRNIRLTFKEQENAVDGFCSRLLETLDTYGIPLKKLCACGIIVPMASDEADNIFGIGPAHNDTLEKELDAKLTAILGVPVYFEFRTRALTYAEHALFYPEEDDMIYIDISDNLEMGMIVNGELVYGHSGHCGSIGHMAILDNGRICRCGKTGCVETEVSGHALIGDIIQQLQEGKPSLLRHKYEEKGELLPEDIIEAIDEGDTLAMDQLEHIGKTLGKLTSGLINVLNPGVVVLGGEFKKMGDSIFLPFMASIRTFGKRISVYQTRIALSRCGEEGYLMGGCLLARRHLFGLGRNTKL